MDSARDTGICCLESLFFKIFFWQWVERLVTRLSKHRKWSRVHLMEEIKFAYALPSNTDW